MFAIFTYLFCGVVTPATDNNLGSPCIIFEKRLESGSEIRVIQARLDRIPDEVDKKLPVELKAGAVVKPTSVYSYRFEIQRAGEHGILLLGQRVTCVVPGEAHQNEPPVKVLTATAQNNKAVVVYKDRHQSFVAIFTQNPDDSRSPVVMSESIVIADVEARGFVIWDAQIIGSPDMNDLNIVFRDLKKQPFRFRLTLQDGLSRWVPIDPNVQPTTRPIPPKENIITDLRLGPIPLDKDK